jgi:type I restriction enzyme S subunit
MRFYKETNFKDTEIGRIPKEWEVVRLNDRKLAVVIMGQSPPSRKYNKEGKGIPFLQGKMEFGDIYPLPIIYCSQPIKIAEQNDILISVRAPVGDVNIAPYRLCIGRGLASIRFNPETANYWFYFYYLQRIKSSLENLGKGSTFKAITKDDLENLKMVYPPLPEQQKIAEILSMFDKAIQKTNEIIAKTERLKKGLMEELLTKGIGHKEFKDTEIGRIPKDWEVKELEKVSILIRSGTTPLKSKKEYWNGNIPFVTQADMTKVDRYLYETSEKITELGLKSSNLFIVPENSVLLSMYGTIGKVIINKIPVAISQNIAAIILNKEKVNEEYLHYALQTYSSQFKRQAKTITLRHLDIKIVKKILIPLPSLQEQQKIAEILSTIDKKLEIERKQKEKLERIKQGMMDLLLTGKIRVKVA